MIALLLASQIVGMVPSNPNLQAFAAPAPPRSSEIIRQLPRKAACRNDLGRLEVSFAQPIALYRQGDRPPKPLKNWADYPDGVSCWVEDAK
ncbi:hypothetical protein [Phenylobacterium sp.]|uniref:hypothetical protein n=1 Tax=Phenylobacterium sp. TaxID=1871053 RepID=UPI002B51CC35|nr:hypothetical protein [Phenylobacterium sp.]HLZ74356.1 hypothetical protein [Phenylobacterium sp.]